MNQQRAFRYVREYYGVPAEVGRRVTVDNRPGIIVEECGSYVGVNFDDADPTSVMPCHPTWKIEYLGMGKPRPLTRGQKNYREYLKVADCFENFLQFLKWKQSNK